MYLRMSARNVRKPRPFSLSYFGENVILYSLRPPLFGPVHPHNAVSFTYEMLPMSTRIFRLGKLKTVLFERSINSSRYSRLMFSHDKPPSSRLKVLNGREA